MGSDPTASTGRQWLRRAPSAAAGYAAALAVVAVSLAFRYAFRETLGLEVPFLQFYPAIIAAAWYGGLGPGLLSTALCTGVAMYFLLPPDGLPVANSTDRLALAVFVATGFLIAWLSHRMHTAETGQRSSTQAALARAERLDAILNTTLDGIIVIDASGRIESFNHSAEQMFGYPASEAIGRNVSMLMPSPHHEAHDSYLQRYLTTGEAKIIGIGREVTARRRDGTSFPVHLSVGEMRIAGERKFTGLLHDLTKRVHLRDQLQVSEARWRAVIDSAVDGIIVIDTFGRVEAFNRGAEQLFGYAEQEVLGRNVDMLMPSPYREEHDTYLARYLATGRAKIIGIGREVQARRKDGTCFPVHLSVGQLIVGGERKFTGILHDLTPRVRMESQLREQATLVKLGEMAAVLAHEVKNPLAGIRGAIQVVGTRMPADNPSAPILKEIVSRIDSLDAMMKDLLLFARPPKPRLEAASMVQIVNSTIAFLRQDPLLREVEILVEGSAPPVAADADMMKIVLQNLIINAAHAMDGKGTLRVSIAAADSACAIAIVDSGPGIPEDVRQKIFEPFFTTKSRGTGLGLPTVKRLVEAHHGDVTIECPRGGGTAVTIRIPLGAPADPNVRVSATA
jgi:PAS domain S-box-containing protein